MLYNCILLFSQKVKDSVSAISLFDLDLSAFTSFVTEILVKIIIPMHCDIILGKILLNFGV